MQEDGQSAGITLRGHLDYEYKKPAADLSDYTKEVFKEGAVDMFVTVYEGDEIIGMGLTSPGDGKLAPGDFELTLSKAPTTKSNLYFWPLLFDDSGSPRLAVAKAKSTKSTEETSDAYYSFGFATCATDAACAAKEIDAGALLVDAAHDSGVIHIFQWLDYTLFRVEGMPSLGRGLMSLVAFWAKDNAYECGSCWVPPQLGLPTVTYDAANQLTDYFDSGLAVSGTDATPDHWSRSAINHELGHWTMHSYAVAQGGCGGDLLDEKSQMSPDIAFDEGFATFFGQANVSHDPSDNEPITFRKSQGTVFWADLGKLTSSLGKLPLPAPGGKLDQPLNPNVAAGMLWSLWAGKNAIAPQNLGDAPFFAALPTYRFTNGDRGFAGTDLVDYLDALTCDKGATLAQIGAVTKAADFPYDSLPTCQ